MMEEDGSQDPLGARDHVVYVDNMTRWNFTVLPLASDDDSQNHSESEEKVSPFPWRNDLNNKIILWSGDITELSVHAIVHSTNERMTERSSVTETLYTKAGPKLEAEIKNNIKVCKTGDAKISEGFDLLSRYVIHTVGPRYNVKYVTAAEGALFCSYRNVLQLVRENSIRTLGLCCVHSGKRGYPPKEGAHIAIRTVRRFLEKYGSDVDAIIFVCDDGTYNVYEEVLPLYFPRNPQEEQESLAHLPEDIGDDMGEPVIPERQIRIMDKPIYPKSDDRDFDDKTVDLNAEFGKSINGTVGQHPFASMQADPDTQKRLNPRSDVDMKKVEARKRYERLLKRARTEDLTDIASLRCLYRTGQDRFGRPVIVFVGRNFPASTVDLEKALLYAIRLLDPIVEQDYVVVYFHTHTSGQNLPPMNFLKNVYHILDHKYKKNLKSFYVVHPTWWSKFATWFFTTFTASDIKQKVHSLKGVQYLYAKINPDQLDIPSFVLDYDIKENGPRYCVPFEEGTVEEL
ncbi:protein GDAP2 homolog [Mya arenaria]|uniref:protein GDAP2 homolog n=1 Tax=Mya arenaria TaxID=6604 RepID=UPI0022E171C6|nr:protein GDAP2 homolog [Mya arenaria]